MSQEGWAVAPAILRRRPETYTAAVSCWIRPEGNFFALNFRQDGAIDPTSLGWDMEVLYKPINDPDNPVSIPFRSPAPGGGPDGTWVDGGGTPIHGTAGDTRPRASRAAARSACRSSATGIVSRRRASAHRRR